MNDPLITLAELVAEGLGSSVHGGPNADTLAAQLAARGIAVVLDDVGRRAVARSDARALLAERTEQQAAAEQADARARAEATSAADSPANVIRRSIAARKARQLQLRRENPDLSSAAIMALSSGDPDRDLERAGSRTGEFLDAGRRGHLGVMHRFSPTNHRQKG